LQLRTTASDRVQDFHADLLEDLFLFLLPQSESKSAQPFARVLRITLHSEGLKTRVACLRAILRVRPATTPHAEIFFWQAVLTKAAGPTAANADGTSLADLAVNMPCFPRRSSEVGFGLKHFARDTRFLDLAGQTYSIEAALSLSVLHRKILFHVPLFADITLPRRSNICVVLGTFSAHPCCVVSFPLSGGEGTILSSFTAD
jgi:hypothetical protein